MPEQAKKTLRERMANKAGQLALIHWMIRAEDGPVVSGGLPGGKPGQPFGPGRFTVACNPERRNDPGFLASGEPHAVTCPDCMNHPLYAKSYEPRPGDKYEEIPAPARTLIEDFEKLSAGENHKPALTSA